MTSHDRFNIGTYKEFSVHSVLKKYCCEDKSCHEVKTDGFIADIKEENRITEIQTSGFYTMKKKLEVFLRSYEVTVVHPIAHTKWVAWIDPETGEIVRRNRSPKKALPSQLLAEMYGIIDFLPSDNLKFAAVMLEITDYRLMDGYGKDKKHRSTKYDRTPSALIDVINIETVDDIRKLVPVESGTEFTAKELSKAARLTMGKTYGAIKVLEKLGFVTKIGKQGKANLYKYR